MEKRFNTGETNTDLKATYNPEGSELRNIQERLLNMLDYVDEVCKKLNIEYYIDGGSYLGAVRHGGFIPWDDDIDVVINVRDYKKLCEYLISHPHPNYILQNHKTDPGYYFGWAKLRDKKTSGRYVGDNLLEKRIHENLLYNGISIDLFCYSDHVIQILNKALYKIHQGFMFHKLLGKHKHMMNVMYFICFNILKPLVDGFSLIFSRRKYYGHDYLSHNCVHRFKKDHIFPLKEITYEGKQYKAPWDTDYFLNFLYGDYMNLPPKSKRGHHGMRYDLF